MLNFKEISKRVLATFDYELRRRSRYYVDAFGDQRKLLKNRDVGIVLDVGSNVGQSVSIYREIFPKATIYCFEPTEEAFNILSSRYKDFQGVKLYQMAVSDVTGAKSFYINKASVTNSLLPVNTEKLGQYIYREWAENVAGVEVKSIKLDDFFREAQIDRIAVLKMDIQGGELMALKGAEKILDRQAIDLIYTEVLFGNAYKGQGYFHELCGLLLQFGYTLYGIYNLVRASNGTLYQGDAIFISSQIEAEL